MSNQIPVCNYILKMLDDNIFWINITKDHIILINELLDNELLENVDELNEKMDSIYHSLESTTINIDNVREFALNSNKQFQFLFTLCFNTIKNLQELSDINISFVTLLGDLEKIVSEDTDYLILNHITLEQKYFLELLSSYINKVNTLGFF